MDSHSVTFMSEGWQKSRMQHLWWVDKYDSPIFKHLWTRVREILGCRGLLVVSSAIF